MRGADLVVRTLANAGVRTIFTLSGNQIMPVFDACIDAGIRLIHVRHEAAAVHMADAWGQVTGEVGVALVTAAPGFANALSPLYSARANESPVLLLSGDSPVSQDRRGAFQEMPQCDIAVHLAKATLRPRTGNDLGHDLARAIRIVRTGRPGPVHMALPFDLLNGEAAESALPAADAFLPEPTPLGAAAARDILAALAVAKRPLILTGPLLNASRAGALLDRLADALDAPVVAMESPRGLREPSLGAFAEMLPQADVIVALGKRIDFTLGYAVPPITDPACRLLAIDPEQAWLDRASNSLGDRLALACRADAGDAAETLIAAAGAHNGERAAWRSAVAEANAFRGSYPAVKPGSRVPSWAPCQAVRSLLDNADEPVLVSDGGEFGQWAQAEIAAPTRLTNGPGGAIGGGLCFAIAVKLARPEATVVATMGDGTAGFHFSEFETAARYGISIIAIIGNDARWNAEHVIQMRDFGADRLIGCELSPARYDLAAAGLGCHGEHVTDPADMPAALARAAASGRPACINVEIEGQAGPLISRSGQAPVDVH